MAMAVIQSISKEDKAEAVELILPAPLPISQRTKAPASTTRSPFPV
jgi:hypothetical protein